jgi:hypothetical protein
MMMGGAQCQRQIVAKLVQCRVGGLEHGGWVLVGL